LYFASFLGGNGRLQARRRHHGLPLSGDYLGQRQRVLELLGCWHARRFCGSRNVGGVEVFAERRGWGGVWPVAPFPASRQRAAARHQLGARAQALRAPFLLPWRQRDLRAAVPVRRLLPLWLSEPNRVSRGLLLPRGRLRAHCVRGELRLRRGGPVRAPLVLAHGQRHALALAECDAQQQWHVLAHPVNDTNAQRFRRPPPDDLCKWLEHPRNQQLCVLFPWGEKPLELPSGSGCMCCIDRVWFAWGGSLLGLRAFRRGVRLHNVL
jgi:hypothetical protein